MSLSASRQRDLFALLHTLRDDRLSAAQSTNLREILAAEDEALQIYLDHAFLIARLRWALHGDAGVTDDAATEPDTTAHRAPQIKKISAWPRRVSKLMALAASLALVGYFVSVAALLVWDRFSRTNARVDVASRDSEERFARLVHADDSAWSPSSTGDAPHDMRKLQVRSGLARLKFAKGAEVTLKGPAEFVVRSASEGYLRRGKLVAKVPPAAVGFTIETATAKVVDLGTEFGIEAVKHGETKVEVLKGRVSVLPIGPAARSPVEAVVVRAGQSRRIRADGTMDAVEVAASGSLSGLLTDRPTRRHERRHFPDGLVGYWALDEDEATVEDSFGISHGEVRVGRRTGGLVGDGALQTNAKSGQLAEIYSCEAKGTFSQALSIEALFTTAWQGKPGDYDFLCRRQVGSRNLISLAFKSEGGDAAVGPVLAFEIETNQGRQVLILALDGQAGRPSVGVLAKGKRHHVVATLDGAAGAMKIYFDGALCAARNAQRSMVLSEDELPADAATTAERHFDDTFSGVLDEVAVYSTALSPEDVALHWKRVSQGRSYFTLP